MNGRILYNHQPTEVVNTDKLTMISTRMIVLMRTVIVTTRIRRINTITISSSIIILAVTNITSAHSTLCILLLCASTAFHATCVGISSWHQDLTIGTVNHDQSINLVLGQLEKNWLVVEPTPLKNVSQLG